MTSTVLHTPTPAPQLPTCPDGSGDLWWDDASYSRYQAWDGGTYEPTHLERLADLTENVEWRGVWLYTTDYCDRAPVAPSPFSVLF